MSAIRDPVHDWINFSPNERLIIDSPLFQRLNWVSQLSVVKQVFPGGTHTRFNHSLGVMNLAGKYMTHLLERFVPGDSHFQSAQSSGTVRSSDYYLQLARLAGLLHDIGHGPFSHAFDRSIYSQIYGIMDGGHDQHRLEIVRSSFLAPLIRGCGIDPEDIVAVWNSHTSAYQQAAPQHQNLLNIIRCVVQGPLGADRMDFVLRDSFFTGTTHLGTISASRIITNAILKRYAPTDPSPSSIPSPVIPPIILHYKVKCLSDIIQALAGRHFMYDSVYLHKTCDAASILVEEIMAKAAHHLDILARTADLEQFQWLNDYTIIGEVMSYRGQDPEMQAARKLCQELLQRRLPKLLDQWVVDEYKPFDAEEYRQAIIATHGQKYPPSGLIIRRTRSVRDIDPKKFEAHNIRFWEGYTNSSISCAQALERARYTCPQKGYYLVRVYLR